MGHATHLAFSGLNVRIEALPIDTKVDAYGCGGSRRFQQAPLNESFRKLEKYGGSWEYQVPT